MTVISFSFLHSNKSHVPSQVDLPPMPSPVRLSLWSSFRVRNEHGDLFCLISSPQMSSPLVAVLFEQRYEANRIGPEGEVLHYCALELLNQQLLAVEAPHSGVTLVAGAVGLSLPDSLSMQ